MPNVLMSDTRPSRLTEELDSSGCGKHCAGKKFDASRRLLGLLHAAEPQTSAGRAPGAGQVAGRQQTQYPCLSQAKPPS